MEVIGFITDVFYGGLLALRKTAAQIFSALTWDRSRDQLVRVHCSNHSANQISDMKTDMKQKSVLECDLLANLYREALCEVAESS